MNKKEPIPPLWLCLWVPILAMAWIIPNHYYPWATFHTDAWVAVMLTLASAAVVFRSARAVAWHGFPMLIAFLAVVPFFQFAIGILFFSGQAWVATAYLLGFLLVLLVGSQWESAQPGRAVDALFLAIGIAAIISVGMQLRQWLKLEVEGDIYQVWFADFSPDRPSANLGQPNQLATLLLWSLIACGWGVLRKEIKPISAIFVSLYILFGLVLTQSRIALVAMFCIVLGVWIWRRLWTSRFTPWAVTLLFVCFVLCTFELQYISNSLLLDVSFRSVSMGGASSMLRLKAYALFIDAIWQQPWLGYGWYQLPIAQFAVAAKHPSLTALFTHSHNLFLDLILWCGLPIGGFVSFFLLKWLIGCIRHVRSEEEVVLLFFLVAVGLHAMVEFPLHHAYFLLPAGLIVGVLNQRQKNSVLMVSGRWVLVVLWVCAAFLLFAIIRDYLRVESNFRAYRLEGARIGNLPPGQLPDVLILNDFQEFMRNARLDVTPDISDKELEERMRITNIFPTPANMFNLTKSLVFRGRYEEAMNWVIRIQKVQPFEYALDMQKTWETQARVFPAMAKLKWPSIEELNSVSVFPDGGYK